MIARGTYAVRTQLQLEASACRLTHASSKGCFTMHDAWSALRCDKGLLSATVGKAAGNKAQTAVLHTWLDKAGSQEPVEAGDVQHFS